jgi:phosphonate transport system substrate-binding protein
LRITRKHMFRSLLLYCLLIAQLANAQPPKLVVATYQYADNNRIANIKPLADHLGARLNRGVEVRSYATVHEFINALQKNEVDIALINTFGYLLLDASDNGHDMIPVAVLQPKPGTQDNYKTAILARKSAGITSMNMLSQTAGKLRLALVSPGSTSGNLVPRLALSRLQLSDPEQQFLRVSYSGNHKLAIDSLLENKADVCAAGSTEYLKLLQDSSRAAHCNLLWLSPEIPLGPVLVNKRLSGDIQKKIGAALLSLHHDNTVALESVKKGWSEAREAEKYVPFANDYYAPFLAEIGTREAIKTILAKFAN